MNSAPDGQSEHRSPADLAVLARAAGATIGLELVPGRLVDSGWDNRVLFCTDGGDRSDGTGRSDGALWILRFPRRRQVLADVERERALLALLDGRLPVAVPRWQIDTVVDGQVVVGYRAVAGHPAGHEPRGDGDFDLTIGLPPPDAYRSGLVRALVALHAIDPTEVVAATGEPLPDPAASRNRARGLVQRFAADLPLPGPLADHWLDRLADGRLWDAPTVLRHGDLHPEHTLIDDDGAITGIIDWTDAGLGDPAADFLDPRHAFGSDFGDAVIADYLAAGGIGDPALRDRVALLQSIGPLAALAHGTDVGRPDLVRRAAERIEAMSARLALTGAPLA